MAEGNGACARSIVSLTAKGAAVTRWQEFREHWRPALAATIGMGAGLSLIAYINGVFAPYLLAEFHWSKAEYALLGSITILSVVCTPFVGRLTDIFGVMKVASVGVCAFPMCCVLFSQMNGRLDTYLAIAGAQIVLA